ncbi:PREDICTED: peroxisomal targeting signal 2 receptor [Nicrophorus vespilloides]|uniref:Peroxin-7 n=1 Tax=Nicrophorus vespilloides TaxID=110193 RepID=A0ABM1MN43_NICVS|nr:PREDICTED: peroxisomal targeting signal 2 receptor [Nicrophorus vespilloides]
MATYLTPNRHGYSVRFSPFNANQVVVATSQYFGLAGGGTLFLLELVDGKLVERNNFQWSDGLFDCVWSEVDPNIVVSASGDGGLQIWNLTGNVPCQTLNEHKKEVYSVDWTRTRQDQLIVSASWDRSIKVWNPTRKISLNTYLGHSQLVYNAMWSPHLTNCFASVSGDGNLKLWNTLNSTASMSFRAHDAEVLTCDWCKYDQNIIATGGSDGLIRGWDLRSYAQPIFQLKGCEYAVRRVQFSPHCMSLLAGVSYDYTTRLWDFKNGSEAMETIKHHSEFVYGLDWSNHKQGELADCGWDSLVHVFTPNSVINMLNL